MKLIVKSEYAYLKPTDDKLKDDIHVTLDTDYDLSKYTTKVKINDGSFKNFDKRFKIPEKHINSSVVVKVKFINKENNSTKTYTTDKTNLHAYVTTEEPFDMSLPESFEAGMKRIKAVEKGMVEEQERILKEFEELNKRFNKISKAVVELGRKGELL